MVLAGYQIVAVDFLLGAVFLPVHCLLFFNPSSCRAWICVRFSVRINNTLARYYTVCLAAVWKEQVGDSVHKHPTTVLFNPSIRIYS